MRFMISARIPTENANAAIKDGTFRQTLQSIMEELKPEAAYFTDIEGARGGYFIVNMDDASELPAKAEPLFFGMGATIQVHLVMTPEDLDKATPRWSRQHRSTVRIVPSLPGRGPRRGLGLCAILSGTSKGGKGVRDDSAADYRHSDNRPGHNHPTIHLRSGSVRGPGSSGAPVLLLSASENPKA